MGDHFDFPQVKSNCDMSFGSATCPAVCKLINKKWEKKGEGGSGAARVAVGLSLALRCDSAACFLVLLPH